MKISRSWLSDYVDLSALSSAELSEKITTKVAEVDGVHHVGEPIEEALVAKIDAVSPHPKKAELKLATLDLGREKVTVVCGAPNCRAGIFSIYIPVGGKILKEGKFLTVDAREIAGIASQGLLASEAELDISNDHSGVIELSNELFGCDVELKAGMAASTLLGDVDTVIEIDNKSVTHRPDLWGHLGFARELSALLNQKLRLNPDAWADNSAPGAESFKKLSQGKSNFSIEIQPATKCPRFAAVEIRGVAVRRSPLWLRRRLHAVGAGVRNTLVDLSNYVMHDVGQPNHTFDADKLSGGKVFVRMAQASEKLRSLDGIDRELSADDIVVADSAGPQSLAGIIGGDKSAISDGTTRILLEAANWDPVLVRQSAKRHQVRTDASNRFEKSQSPFLIPLGIQRYWELLHQIDGGAALEGAVIDQFPTRPQPISITTKYDYIRTRLGHTISDTDISRILTGLGFSIENKGSEILVGVPYYRATRDISIADDLVEEVGRILGYEQITEVAPLVASTVTPTGIQKNFEYEIQDLLRGIGFSDLYSYSMTSSEKLDALGYQSSECVFLRNPLDSSEDCMRSTLVPAMLQLIESNARFQSRILLSEFGRGYRRWTDEAERAKSEVHYKNLPARERRLLSLGFAEHQVEEAIGKIAEPGVDCGANFYALAQIIRRIVRLVTARPVVLTPCRLEHSAVSADRKDVVRNWMHPYRAATVHVGSVEVGVIAEVRPGELDASSLRPVIAELDLESLLACAEKAEFFGVPKFPDSFFEMSIIMPEAEPYSSLEKFLRQSVDRSLLRNLEVLSLYRGKPLPEGTKSISVKCYLGHADRTLSRDELGAIQQTLMAAVRSSEFTLRG